MSSAEIFKHRVNEKRGVSRRQSGASNRISGLESDTPFYEEPYSFYIVARATELSPFIRRDCPVGFGIRDNG